MKPALPTAAGLAALVLAPAAAAAPTGFGLTGSDAEGYFAVVGFNQEGGIQPSDLSRDPASPKFFDYPSYANPSIAANTYVFSVEPYRFGLSYPDPLHPTGSATFASIDRVVEGVTEDADFADFAIGGFRFDGSAVTGVGTEIVGADALTLTLDGTDFESRNRNAFQGTPGDPGGRSNNNEFANIVSFTQSGSTGTGLTFEKGVLAAIDLVVNVNVNSTAAAAGSPSAFIGFDAAGTLTFSGDRFAFDIDGTDSSPFGQNVRVLLNRSGTLDAVGAFVVPEPASAALLAAGTALLARRRRG
ncbi:PEP-CTERM sorting domain-containing protein [Phycisphaera mikurensis]|uniref:PEP-CTERM protein-sorting domain-containing protein n=1 Tax=Phycisphaera mikurensis (strain NBRC 102666 / KCTC 22515 / FYK2301M01) TaxID=1142394 RepID=I0IH96_PHYMF|nr:PEP-CTERM sorting domain-containing protein [Phycisphaera mikurensis]MBB6440883.1 hypothetical protein [Phycisphaera mikurensis]BAM04634.1 hypothetical protein PSMK_24750 [Phycisphaera mikurensis NBRC 102666]